MRNRGKTVLKWLTVFLSMLLLIITILYFYFFHLSVPNEPDLSGELKNDVFEIEGNKRTFSYYIPKQLDAKSALIFVLHGSKSYGNEVRKQTGYEFDRIADTDKFIVVYPDGYENHWNDCRANATYSANTRNIDDITFFSEMFDFFINQYNIDSSRIFITGYSNGGHMAYRLAFEIPDQIAGIAPIAANLPIDDNLACEKQTKPISVAIFNGTEDPINPYHGGYVILLGDSSRGAVYSSRETANYWVSLASTDGKSEIIQYDEVGGNSGTTVLLEKWK